MATILVQRGTLRVGDSIVAGPAYGRVRAMLDEHGDEITEADPSRPAMVLGLTAVPGAGQNFLVVDDDRMARQIAEKREARERAAMQAKRRVRRTLEDFMASMEKGESQELNLILKGDVSGSVEALEDALSRSTSATRSASGSSTAVSVRSPRPTSTSRPPPTRSSSASTSGPQGKATEMADRKVSRSATTRSSTRRSRRSRRPSRACSSPSYEESVLGQAEIRAIFRSSKIGNIAGCMVTSGVIRRNAKVRVLRDGAVVADNLDLASLQAGEGRRLRGPRGLRVRSGAARTSRTSRKATSSRPSRWWRSRAAEPARPAAQR